MQKFREIFNHHLGNKLYSDIERIDELCEKLDINPKDFWIDFEKQKGHFSEFSPMTELLERFYWFLEKCISDKLKSLDYKNYGGFYIEGEEIEISEEEGEGFIDLPFKVKEEMMRNKIFNYFMEKTQYDLFTKIEKRKFKLLKIDESI